MRIFKARNSESLGVQCFFQEVPIMSNKVTCSYYLLGQESTEIVSYDDEDSGIKSDKVALIIVDSKLWGCRWVWLS